MTTQIHSDYFIDEVGIYKLNSRSYPDEVWKDYRFKIGQDPPEKFEQFIQAILLEGKKQKIKEINNVLGIRT